MLWLKRRYSLRIKGGKGTLVTDPCHGFIQQMIIIPESSDTVWSVDILDRDGDSVYEVKDCEGKLNDREGLPIGKDSVESFKFNFYGFTKNENILVVLNIKEVK